MGTVILKLFKTLPNLNVFIKKFLINLLLIQIIKIIHTNFSHNYTNGSAPLKKVANIGHYEE